MNLVNFYITKIISAPYYQYDMWWVKVYADSHGIESEHTLMFDTKERAASLYVGYEFDA